MTGGFVYEKRFLVGVWDRGFGGDGAAFSYDVPRAAGGLFAPVNESVWEHLKLFFWPTLAAAFVLTRKK